MFRLLLLFLVAGITTLQAQQSSADTIPDSEKQAAFLTDLENLMTNGKSKDVENAYRDFEKNFTSGVFTPDEKLLITNLGIIMRSRKLGATPHFQSYLEVLSHIKTSAAAEGRFQEWHGVFEEFLTQQEGFRANSAAAFLRFSKNFFEFKALNYSPSSTSWFVYGDDYTWSFDGQPILNLGLSDLMASRQDDSIFIRKTTGICYPLEKRFEGEGGTTNWERTDLGNQVEVILKTYTLETNRSLYESSEAELIYPLYFSTKKIQGTFSDKLVSDAGRATYPRFESDANFLEISNVGEGVRLHGGFKLHGTTVYAYGTKDKPAEVLLLNFKNQPRFIGRGDQFTVRNQERISGENVQSTFYLGTDSLFHPAVFFRYNIVDQEVKLSRGDRGSNRNPFYHSLHKMNIEADYINAYLRNDSLVVGKPTVSFANKDDAIFESVHYFNKGQYQKLQSIASANPLAIMKATAEREGNNFIDAQLVAQRIDSRFTVETIQPLLYELVAKGFINYDLDKQEIELKDKIYHYVNADLERVDFDYLKIRSVSDSINAVIDLNSGQSVLNGVKQVEFSKVQKVAAQPLGQQIFVQDDRNFDFDGKIFAGFSVFEGKDHHFQYEPFQVQLDSVRYFDLFVPTGDLDENQQPVAHSIGSRIEHVNGVLLIDAPDNKAGREDIFIFPSLQSKNESYVYYDWKDTKNGLYVRDSFYFELEPFSFDHLDKFGPQDLKFEGTLFSNGMFPDFKETLVLIEEDQSLGFSRETPEGGFPAYQAKGNYVGDINLSNSGLLGKGELKYLGATINSEDFAFMPNQTTATADRFDLEEDKEGPYPVPQVRGEEVRINWLPYRDSMIVNSDIAPFKLYKANDHQLEGQLILTPDGLKGNGLLSWSGADATSEIFNFGPFSAQADTMNLSIRALEGDDRLALQTDNINGILDFDEQEGRFVSNDKEGLTTLPYNEYITTMNKFTWDMKGSTIEFETDGKKKGVFTSIHADQDSLNFEAAKAVYDLRSSLLHTEGVEYIVTADAFVYPDSQYVQIAPYAKMATLENARILADTSNKYHVINRATVRVKGRRNYEASGFYEYNVGPHEQEFELQNIIGQPIGKGALSEKRTETRATGEIEPSDTFFIDHKTQFRGTIHLNAQSPTLAFEGFAQINAENLPRKNWFTLSSEGDKNDLAISYDIPKSYDGDPLYTGLYLSKDYGLVYPSVMSVLHFRKDRQILPTYKGVFKYDEDKDQFIFGDSTIVVGDTLVGNKMIFKNVDGSVEAEGKFNLGQELKYGSVYAAGRAYTKFPPPPPEVVEEEEEEGIMLIEDPEEEEPPAMLVEGEEEEEPQEEELEAPAEEIPFTAEFMLGINMNIPDQLLRIVENDFKSASFDTKVIAYLTDIGFYQKTVRELLPATKDRDDALDGMSLGYLDLPKRINPYTFLFSKVPMRWNSEYQSFVSTEKELGLISVNGESLNKMAECYIEVKMPSTTGDDRLYVYLKSPSGLFYFFGLKQGIMSITSNNTVFMQQLNGMKPKDLVMKMDDGDTYEIQAVEVGSGTTFLRRAQAGM